MFIMINEKYYEGLFVSREIVVEITHALHNFNFGGHVSTYLFGIHL
jgi:hypothetical protein